LLPRSSASASSWSAGQIEAPRSAQLPPTSWVPKSAEARALVEKGYLRQADVAPILGVTKQRVSQIVAEREDFPKPAKVVG
jgi:hypothetical protein